METRVAIVTGASSGIGEATAILFAERGWAVVLAARSAEKLAAVAHGIRERGGTALPVRTDVTNAADRVRLVEQTLAAFGRIDALINNAGMGISGTIETLDLDDMAYVFDLNVLTPLALTQAVVPYMRQQAWGSNGLRGVIVNVSSIIEALPVPFMSGYGATKAALAYFTDAAAVELARDRIAVVRVTPGLTSTGFEDNIRASGVGVSFEQLLAKASLLKTAPAGRAAEKIWRAVGKGKTLRAWPLRDRVVVIVARLFPRLVNRLLIAATSRYTSPEGTPTADDVGRDLRTLGLTAGSAAGATAAIAVAAWLYLHRHRGPVHS